MFIKLDVVDNWNWDNGVPTKPILFSTDHIVRAYPDGDSVTKVILDDGERYSIYKKFDSFVRMMQEGKRDE